MILEQDIDYTPKGIVRVGIRTVTDLLLVGRFLCRDKLPPFVDMFL